LHDLHQAWPVALASQLAYSSSQHPRHGAPSRAGPGAPLLLQALLGLAGCLAKGCSEGKKAFIFAGPDGETRGARR